MKDISTIQEAGERIAKNISQVIVGKQHVIELLLVSLLCEGHVLLEDVPGIGKTTLAKALAQSLNCSFQRIQFTPDLLPSDITGTSVYNQKTGEFEFRPGPIFAQVVLADEINRASPRTQSALLEAMQERQVTVDGVTYSLPRPFLVIATENPIELEGTFPLPEAQLDRFLLRLKLGYPSKEEERLILHRFKSHDPLEELRPVIEGEEIISFGKLCRQVYIHPAIEDYILALARASREYEGLSLGVSPRGTLYLYHTSQALAALRGRSFVLPDDVQELIEPVWAHRLIPSRGRRLQGESVQEILKKIVAQVPVPVEENWAVEDST
ncbi:MAG: MoxR family ATPase [Anaerolineae bacterium]|nr:MoxR family ATPase [Anaerolineae bacterium]